MLTTRRAPSPQALWSEMHRLEAEVAALQQRLAEYSEDAAQPATRTVASTEPSFAADDTQADDPWSVWPYCWVIALHGWLRERFHSFHQNLDEARLRRDNRRRLIPDEAALALPTPPLRLV